MDRSDVFLSYRRKDVDFVKLVDQALKKSGREVWVDWEDIPPGVEGFADEIQQGIEGADAFIAVLSPSYLESEYCLMELREALRLKKRIVPIVYLKFEPAPPPEGIGHINWVYFTPHAGQDNGFDDAFPKVIQALEADYEHAREHTRLLLRAIDWDKRSRNTSYLLKGAEIEKAEGWHVAGASKDPAPTELQGEYILLSRKQQRRQQQIFTGVIGAFLVIAAIAAVFAIFQASEARRQEALAVTAQAEAVAAKDEAVKNADIAHSSALTAAALLPGNEEIAVALGLEATRSENVPASKFTALSNLAWRPGAIRYSQPRTGGGYTTTPPVSPDGEFYFVDKTLYSLKTGQAVRQFEDVPGYMLSGFYMPDGRRIVLAGDDDGVLDTAATPVLAGLYDAETGKLIHRFDTKLGVANTQLAGDGKTLITYMPDERIMLWDIDSGEKLREIPAKGLPALSPDLKWLATIETITEEDGTTTHDELVITELESSKSTRIPLEAGTPGFMYVSSKGTVRFSPDSTELVVANYLLTSYAVATGKVLRTYNGHTDFIETVNYSPDGQTLVSAGADHQVLVWNRKTAEIVARLIGHKSTIVFADYVRGGAGVISADESRLIAWDLWQGNIEKHTLVDVKEGYASISQVAPDDSALVIAVLPADFSTSTQLITLDMATLTEQARITMPVSVSAVDLSQGVEKGRVLYGSNLADAPEVHIASLSTGKDEYTWPLPGPLSSIYGTFTADGKRVLLSYYGDTTSYLDLRDVATGEKIMSFPLTDPSTFDLHLNRWLGIVMNDNNEQVFRMLDMTTGETLWEQPADNYVTGIALSPDGTQFVAVEMVSGTGSEVYQASVRDAKTGERIRMLNTPVPYSIGMAISKDGSSVFVQPMNGGGGGGGLLPSGIPVGGYNTTGIQPILELDMMQGDLRRSYEISSVPILLADGKHMLTFKDNNSIDIWRFYPQSELVAWVCANRYVPEFTPEQRAQFNITSETSLCAAAK